MTEAKKVLSPEERKDLMETLQSRFVRHLHRHPGLSWQQVVDRLESFPEKLPSLFAMEKTGGEPDVVGALGPNGEIHFVDCSLESPSGRRSLCYDAQARDARKANKPVHSAGGLAQEMGIELLDEDGYRALQALGSFDTKTSSWIKTPAAQRTLGGALFGDFRYGRVFIYHNGADSYYAVRGFRGRLII